jgi:hypothetical protein
MSAYQGLTTIRVILILLAAVLVLLLVQVVAGFLGRDRVTFDTTYQAVFLTNGHVYFGKLEKAGSAYPVLNEVYYVESRVKPDTKEVTNILVRRGKEWHAPDRMVLNAQHILFIEPVAPESAVSKLIAELKRR